jgi:hypothetical protein
MNVISVSEVTPPPGDSFPLRERPMGGIPIRPNGTPTQRAKEEQRGFSVLNPASIPACPHQFITFYIYVYHVVCISMHASL